ncbi:hypothetical protein PPACK8108_LOCUS23179 [Phakopsora pachyrhizi]|uniref:OTU domain-containing protein n=1 Tax=Phakopsora pachyrhizi TaxID=170000 RepID=A0AAV0BPG0_PHAPC|nr:hypothetical protein PPACK8108_LOCUS23179 [Phakopsora pachyrhizi]
MSDSGHRSISFVITKIKISQYDGYGNPYYGGYYYPYDNQTPYYGYGQPDCVTGHAEVSGSSFQNFEDIHPPHGYPRIYPEYQSPYDVNPSRSTPQSSYIQDHVRSDDDHRNFLVPENEYQGFDLLSRKTSISRRTSVVGSPLPTRMPSISAGSTTDKRKINPTSYETVTQGISIKPMTEHEELMRYIPQPLQRLIEKIDNPPKDEDCGYTCVVWSSGKGRGISTPELIRKHLSAEFKKDKKIYEMIEGKNIDEDIRNTQAGKSAGVAGWLKMPLFGFAIANNLRRPLYYFSLDTKHTYLSTSRSYSGYPPFCMAFVDTNHYVVLQFKNVNGSIPAPPIDGWWLRKSSSRNKNVWLQSLENDLKLFQKLMPLSSGGGVINLD